MKRSAPDQNGGTANESCCRMSLAIESLGHCQMFVIREQTIVIYQIQHVAMRDVTADEF